MQFLNEVFFLKGKQIQTHMALCEKCLPPTPVKT